MESTTNSPTPSSLAENLRRAADLVDALQYDSNITWSGTDDLGLHARTDDQWAELDQRLTAIGYELTYENESTRGDEAWTVARWSGAITVTMFGPTRAKAAA